MRKNPSLFYARVAAGICGGTIFGISRFLTLLNYGGNHGCWRFVDRLFGLQGYESCAQFGIILGILVGSIVGISIVSKIDITKYPRIVLWCLFAAFILPFIYGIIMFWPPLEDSDMQIVAPIILYTMFLASIPSLIIAGFMKWLTTFKK